MARSKQNVTLALDTELLSEIRVIAAKQNKSVSALLAEHLQQYVALARDYQQAQRKALAYLKNPFDGPGTRDWTREDLYADRLFR